MKKRWIAFGTTLVMLSALAIPTLADDSFKKDDAKLRPDYTIVIDGKEMNFKRADGSAAFALVYEDSTYLPLRAIGEALGKNVNWDEKTKTITLEGERAAVDPSGRVSTGARKDVTVQVRNDFTIVIDGVERQFKTSDGREIFPLLYDGSTYLPLRAIGQIMNKEVAWDNVTKTVTLTSSGLTVTDADSFSEAPTVTDADSFRGKEEAPKQNVPKDTAGTKNDIGADRAKEIALDHAGLTEDQVKVLRAETDRDDGRKKYEVDFREGRMEYEYEIDAETGEILKAEKDYDD